ncbi:MAG: hypothetical protein LBS26_04090 [Campylobacteraceae bacterium]|nr:hypothetical protein [Campylobacteraceae bacterium]
MKFILFLTIVFAFVQNLHADFSILNKALEQNKSVIIIPENKTQASNLIWIGEKGETFLKSFNMWHHKAIIVEKGVYRIKHITFKTDDRKTLRLKTEHESSLADALVSVSDEKLYTINYDTNEESRDLMTLNIGEGEVVFMPLVWAEIILAENSCIDISPPRAHWYCPVRAILINIKRGSLEQFKNDEYKNNPFIKRILDNVLGNISEKEFTYGTILKNAKKMITIDDDIEQYAIVDKFYKKM